MRKKAIALFLSFALLTSTTGTYSEAKNSRYEYYFVGDSRTVDIRDVVKNKKDYAWTCKIGMGYYWMKDHYNPGYVGNNTKVVFLMGVNDMGNVDSYAKYYAACKAKHKYVVSVNPIDDNRARERGYKVRNKTVKSFNKKMKAYAEKYNFEYIDTYSQIEKSFYASDGLHYDTKTSKKIFKLVKQNAK